MTIKTKAEPGVETGAAQENIHPQHSGNDSAAQRARSLSRLIVRQCPFDLASLIARFSGLGIEADIALLTESELAGLYRFLQRLAEG